MPEQKKAEEQKAKAYIYCAAIVATDANGNTTKQCKERVEKGTAYPKCRMC
jgi:hypothetical protein